MREQKEINAFETKIKKIDEQIAALNALRKQYLREEAG